MSKGVRSLAPCGLNLEKGETITRGNFVRQWKSLEDTDGGSATATRAETVGRMHLKPQSHHTSSLCKHAST